MNIILLKGVFPLKKKITLSRNLGIELDNPKNKDELEYVLRFLEDKIEFREDKKLLNYFLFSDSKTILHLDYLDTSLKGLLKYHKNNPYFNKNFLKNYTKEKAFSYLAKNWLIVRFDDEGFYKNLKEASKKLRKQKERGIFLLEGTEIGPQREARALKYISIIDLLFLDRFKGSLSKTIILEDKDSPISHQCLFAYITGLGHGRTKFEEFDYFVIADRINKIVEITQKIERLSREQQEKLLFIGEIIRDINTQNRDSRMQFLMLVSIIEFLLTHSPDTSRFNVEDSIRKQFQLKAGVIISEHFKDKLSFIANNLKKMYDIRSMIAHGNFFEIEKFVKMKKKDKEFDFFDLVEELFNYVSIIIKAYIENPNYIESLKKL